MTLHHADPPRPAARRAPRRPPGLTPEAPPR